MDDDWGDFEEDEAKKEYNFGIDKDLEKIYLSKTDSFSKNIYSSSDDKHQILAAFWKDNHNDISLEMFEGKRLSPEKISTFDKFANDVLGLKENPIITHSTQESKKKFEVREGPASRDDLMSAIRQRGKANRSREEDEDKARKARLDAAAKEAEAKKEKQKTSERNTSAPDSSLKSALSAQLRARRDVIADDDERSENIEEPIKKETIKPGKLNIKERGANLEGRLPGMSSSEARNRQTEDVGKLNIKERGANLEGKLPGMSGSAVKPEDIQRMSESPAANAPSAGAPPPPPPPMPGQSAAPTPPPPPPMPGQAQGAAPPPGPAAASPTPAGGQDRANLMAEINRRGQNTREKLDAAAPQGVASDAVPEAPAAAPTPPPPPPMPGKTESNIPPAPPMPESLMHTPPPSPTPGEQSAAPTTPTASPKPEAQAVPPPPPPPMPGESSHQEVPESSMPTPPASPELMQRERSSALVREKARNLAKPTAGQIEQPKNPVVGPHTAKLVKKLEAEAIKAFEELEKPATEQDAKAAIVDALKKIKKGPITFKEKYTFTTKRDGYGDKLYKALTEQKMDNAQIIAAMKDQKVIDQIKSVSHVSGKKLGTGLTISATKAKEAAGEISKHRRRQETSRGSTLSR